LGDFDPGAIWNRENVKNSMPIWLSMRRFSGAKTPVFFSMCTKQKPSIALGDIIKFLMILKLALTILHLLK
jgi:hypothetical protein